MNPDIWVYIGQLSFENALLRAEKARLEGLIKELAEKKCEKCKGEECPKED